MTPGEICYKVYWLATIDPCVADSPENLLSPLKRLSLWHIPWRWYYPSHIGKCTGLLFWIEDELFFIVKEGLIHRGSSTRLPAICFFPGGNHFLWSLSGRNTSDCRLRPPSHFFFMLKQKKNCADKKSAWQCCEETRRIQSRWGNSQLFSDIQTVVPFKDCDKCDIACDECNIACNIAFIACDIACNKCDKCDECEKCDKSQRGQGGNLATYHTRRWETAGWSYLTLRICKCIAFWLDKRDIVCTQSTLVQRWEAHQTTKIGGAKASALRRPISVGSTFWRSLDLNVREEHKPENREGAGLNIELPNS
jgi:hypothetical protein